MKISFIVAAYNAEKYIKKCIYSLVRQGDKDLEIIIIDDGSYDDTVKICHYFKKKYNNINIITQKNKGVSSARNRGLEMAKGKYICFVDADDWIETNLTKVIFPILSLEEDVIFFGHYVIHKNKKRTVLDRTKNNCRINKKEFETLQEIILNRYLNKANVAWGQPWAKLYKKEFLEKNNLKFYEKISLSEDLLFNIQVFEKADSGRYLSQPLYNYRKNRDSVTQKYHKGACCVIEELLHALNIEIEKTINNKRLKKAMDVRSMMSCIYCIVLEICNSDSHFTYRERKQNFIELRNNKFIKKACNNHQFQEFPVFQKIFCIAINKKIFFLIEFMSKIYQKFN